MRPESVIGQLVRFPLHHSVWLLHETEKYKGLWSKPGALGVIISYSTPSSMCLILMCGSFHRAYFSVFEKI